jgi:microcystin-dependent protein
MLKGIKKLTLGVAVIALLATTTLWSAPAQASEPFIGQIMMVGFNFAPRGFATCDGQLLSIAQNTALFSLLGTTFGGDGRTTFGLPDLRGRVAVHVGTGPGLQLVTWGQVGGSNTNTLTVANLPAHNHAASATVTVKGTNARGNSELPEGNTWASRSRDNDYSNVAPDVVMNAASVEVAVTTGNTGGNAAVNNMQPYLGIYHVIALQGIYPSRS